MPQNFLDVSFLIYVPLLPELKYTAGRYPNAVLTEDKLLQNKLGP